MWMIMLSLVREVWREGEDGGQISIECPLDPLARISTIT